VIQRLLVQVNTLRKETGIKQRLQRCKAADIAALLFLKKRITPENPSFV
jgi:hypothetical protein